MTSKSKKQRQKTRQQKQSSSIKEINQLTTKLTLRSSLLARLGITLLAPTILASYALYLYFGSDSYDPYNPTWADAQVLAMIIFLMIVLFFVMSLDITAKIAKIDESPKQKSLRQAVVLNIFTVTMTAIFYLIALQQGYLVDLSNYLKSTIFPSLSEGVNYILSNIVAWIVSGVIGNFAYDLLKRIFQRNESNKTPQRRK
jgi:hypothetical protein